MNKNPAYTVEPYASSVERRDRTAELILHIQRNEYGVPITLEDEPDLLQIETFYQTGKGNFWTALHEGEIIGTIALLDIGQDRAALRKMFVKKNSKADNMPSRSVYWMRLSPGQSSGGWRRYGSERRSLSKLPTVSTKRTDLSK